MPQRRPDWTKDELALLRSPSLTNAQIAEQTGRTISAVEHQRRGLVPKKSRVASKTTVTDDIRAADEAFWHEEHKKLSKKYAAAVKGEAATDRLVKAVLEAAPKSYNPAPAIVRDRRLNTQGTPQSAVLLLSDTHIGKVVKPGQTLHWGDYDFPIFCARLKYLEESILSITQNHMTVPVKTLVVSMLGDMLDGTLIHSVEGAPFNPIFNQFYAGAHAIAQFLRNLAPHFDKIEVFDNPGNHTRFQGQHKMPTDNRHSNFDKFLYALIRALVRDIPSIRWDFTEQPFSLFAVEGFVFQAGHGDNLRGGDKALGIPAHSIGRVVSSTTQLHSRIGTESPHFYLFGHLHRPISLPHAKGEVIVNGGFVGVDGFGLQEAFTPADPCQKFFFVHPKYGKTASYDISLKFAEVTGNCPYSIPPEFPIR